MEAEILNELKILSTLGFAFESLYIVVEEGLVFTEEDVVEMTRTWERGDRSEPMPDFEVAREWYDAWMARNPVE